MKHLAVVALWAVGTAAGFWQFSGRYLIPVSVDRPLKPVPAERQSLMATELAKHKGRIVVVNFWNPDCGCSRFAEPDVRALAERFGPEGVDFITVTTDTGAPKAEQARIASERKVPGMVVVDEGDRIIREFDVLASPAAVVFDRDGNPVYRGAYNAGRFCRDEETAYVRKSLEALLKGETPKLPGLPFYGCSNRLK